MKRTMTAVAVSTCILALVPAVLAADAATDPAPRVRLATTVGDIVLELDRKKAPLSVENFLQYVRDGFYDGLVFHRVIPTFMIQAGGFDAEMNKKTDGLRDPIKNESKNGLSNKHGTIAMARTGAPHSATAQFFINVVDNKNLDASDRMPWGYAVFGKVVEGMDVVDKIKNGKLIIHPKDPGRGREGAVNPDPPVVIKKATIESAASKPDKKQGPAKKEATEKKDKG